MINQSSYKLNNVLKLPWRPLSIVGTANAIQDARFSFTLLEYRCNLLLIISCFGAVVI